MAPGKVWFALTRKSTLHSSTELALRQGGQVIAVFKKGSRVAACKGSNRTRKHKTVKNRENWSLWASRAAVSAPGGEGSSNARAEVEGDSIHLQMMEAQVARDWGAVQAALPRPCGSESVLSDAWS